MHKEGFVPEPRRRLAWSATGCRGANILSSIAFRQAKARADHPGFRTPLNSCVRFDYAVHFLVGATNTAREWPLLVLAERPLEGFALCQERAEDAHPAENPCAVR
jgi:hypothetical protein